MKWNWQQPDWPDFSWKQARLLRAEALFLIEAGEYAGAAKHLAAEDREQRVPPANLHEIFLSLC